MNRYSIGPSDALEFWGRVVNDNQVALTAATYDLRKHGVPSGNIPIPDQIIADRETLNRLALSNESVFAIGSLVYVFPGEYEAEWSPIKEEISRRIQCGEISVKDLRAQGIMPLAIVMADFDCMYSTDSERQIIEILETQDPNTDWILFRTDNGMHLIFNEFVELEDLPWYYGKLIRDMVPLCAEEFRDEIDIIGAELQNHFSDINILREICDFILENAWHNNENIPGKLVAAIDIRWIAHNIIELINLLEGNGYSLAYLRAGKKHGIGEIPKAVCTCRYQMFRNAQSSVPLKTKSVTSGRQERKQLEHFIR